MRLYLPVPLGWDLAIVLSPGEGCLQFWSWSMVRDGQSSRQGLAPGGGVARVPSAAQTCCLRWRSSSVGVNMKSFWQASQW